MLSPGPGIPSIASWGLYCNPGFIWSTALCNGPSEPTVLSGRLGTNSPATHLASEALCSRRGRIYHHFPHAFILHGSKARTVWTTLPVWDMDPAPFEPHLQQLLCALALWEQNGLSLSFPKLGGILSWGQPSFILRGRIRSLLNGANLPNNCSLSSSTSLAWSTKLVCVPFLPKLCLLFFCSLLLVFFHCGPAWVWLFITKKQGQY